MIFQTSDLIKLPFEGRFSVERNATRACHSSVHDFRGVENSEIRKVWCKKILDGTSFATIVILAVLLNCLAQLIVFLILHRRRALARTFLAGAAAIVTVLLQRQ